MTRSRLLITALPLLLLSCQKERVNHRYELVLKVSSDPGRGLAGAEVFHAGRRVGTSNQAGEVALEAKGVEGSVIRFQTRCPEGYSSPSSPTEVKLRRSSDRSRRPEYQVTCAPLLRTLVVAIRSDHGANLPVRYLNEEVARTDESGSAHVLLQGAPSDRVELVLDTTTQPALRPQNPSARFEIAQQDDIQLFQQDFLVERPRRKNGVASAPKKPSGPVRILAR